jgi:hypothetical protein
MPVCVRCKKEAKNLFKGRFLCFPHFQEVMHSLSSILQAREERENEILETSEQVPINSPRHLIDPSSGRVVGRVRGQHFTISKKEIEQ